MHFQTQLNNAFQLFEEGKLNEAHQICNEIFNENLTLKEEVQVRLMYGYLLVEQKQFAEAVKNYQRTLALSHTLEDQQLTSQSYHQIGMVYRVAEEYEEALVHFQKEKAYIDTYFPENKLFQAANAYEMGYTKLLNNEVASAKSHLDISLKYALNSADAIMIACSYRGLGDYYRGKSYLDKAREMYSESMKYFKRADDIKGMQEVETRVSTLN